MRARLLVSVAVPLVGLFLVLGWFAATTWARASAQELVLDRTNDASIFASDARFALQSGEFGSLDTDLRRYQEVHGTATALIPSGGGPGLAVGLDVEGLTEAELKVVSSALAGQQAYTPFSLRPWTAGRILVAVPVRDGVEVLGAVVTATDLGSPARSVGRYWSLLALVGVASIAVATVVASLLSHWIMSPVRRLGEAMEQVWSGNLKVRVERGRGGPNELQDMVSVFNSMTEEVERVLAQQQRFVANASHELRNPVTSLTLSVESLAAELPDSAQEEVEQVRDDVRRLAAILDSLLDLAEGRMGDRPAERLDVTDLVDARIASWRALAEEQGITLRRTASDHVWHVADQSIVESALDALLDNAVKYAPRGTTVDVTVAEGAAPGSGPRITVRDRGPGLHPEEIAHITDRFWRSNRHVNVPGSGLGLSIVQDLLRATGGTVSAYAPADGGLAVVLDLGAAHGARSLR